MWDLYDPGNSLIKLMLLQRLLGGEDSRRRRRRKKIVIYTPATPVVYSAQGDYGGTGR